MRMPRVAGGPPLGRDVAAYTGLFHPQVRRAALAWVCATLPVVVVAGHFAATASQYVVVFALLASGLYTSPAIVNTWIAARRAPHPDNRCWWLWLAALGLMYAIGCAMVIGVATDYATPTALNAAIVSVVAVLLMTSLVLLVRTRSGRRAMSVDLIESAMSVIVVVAPAALVWGARVVEAEAHWYAVPAALATVSMVFGVYWAVLLLMRVRDESHSHVLVGRFGVALALVGLANAVGQTMQGVTGFALPSGPLLGLHALTMSLLLFIPLYVPGTISTGLDRLPPNAQVRGAWLPAALMLVGLPILLVTTLALRDRYAWAELYSLAVAAVLLVLAALRQLAAVRETRRLYHQVELAAATRRQLLAQMMERSDHDRHRVAAQLHEQAVSAYAAFVSFIQASTMAPSGVDGTVASASVLVRDELRDQAESLRHLMMAVQPLEVDRRHAQSLSAPIHAYVDSLYGDRRAPTQVVWVDDDLVLDWSVETVVLRIVQEAVRNVWRHSRATRIEVSVQADDGAVEVVIADDGVGFDPGTVLFESGIAVMRSFAGLGQGTLSIESAPGRGTRVTARLGVADGAPTPPGGPGPDDPGGEEIAGAGEGKPSPRLRLLVGGRSSAASVCEA
ncbi:MAG TPA: ATP-binding protein [Acidimicrobiales bacterium]|nr:ATP-binding protein [Acidimicrobiales bacterium]